jgi:hypothetical protein
MRKTIFAGVAAAAAIAFAPLFTGFAHATPGGDPCIPGTQTYQSCEQGWQQQNGGPAPGNVSTGSDAGMRTACKAMGLAC